MKTCQRVNASNKTNAGYLHRFIMEHSSICRGNLVKIIAVVSYFFSSLALLVNYFKSLRINCCFKSQSCFSKLLATSFLRLRAFGSSMIDMNYLFKNWCIDNNLFFVEIIHIFSVKMYLALLHWKLALFYAAEGIAQCNCVLRNELV